MNHFARKPGFKRIDLLVVLFLLALAFFCVWPMLHGVYVPARRLHCATKQKEMAIAACTYEHTFKRFPPSCHVNGKNKDGYSFLVDLLPYQDQDALWKRLDVNVPLSDGSVKTGVNFPDEAIRQSMPIFRCPNTGTSPYVDEEAPTNQLQAITSYKAVSASTRQAYETSSREDAPADATAADGVMYVGSRTTLADITDGTSHTLLITETEEPFYSRWIVGQECGLYTMAETGKTNLTRDYAKNPYPWGEPGFMSRRYGVREDGNDIRLGPGSRHKSASRVNYVYGIPYWTKPKDIVYHVTVGCSVMAIPTDIDPAAYLSLTTRAGGEPSITEEDF